MAGIMAPSASMSRARNFTRMPCRVDHIEFRPVERDGARGYDLRWSLATRAVVEGNIGVASPTANRRKTHH
jgi:hypothetical protein